MIRLITLVIACFISCTAAAESIDSAELVLGERLFSDFRFSQFFFQRSEGDANHDLVSGDPQLEYLKVLEEKSTHQSPFRDQAMSCAACHMVDQALDTLSPGMRMYADFANVSPIPVRTTAAETMTLRNTQTILPLRPNDDETPLFFHWDGQLHSLEDLTVAGLSGRNMGWLVQESEQALQNIVNIIRNDNGQGPVASDFGGYSYKELFLSEDPLIKEELRLPQEYRLDIDVANDDEIIRHVVILIARFMQSIDLSRGDENEFTGSPYDAFLKLNGLPQTKFNNETALQYSQRLLALLESRNDWKYIAPGSQSFRFHNQDFQFGEKELRGLKFFLTSPAPNEHRPGGACVQCHTPPNFTDSRFHNIGISQLQYERVHGMETFKKLIIPTLKERELQKNLYALPTKESPERLQLLTSSPEPTDPRRADLGMWSLFANSDFAHLQPDFRRVISQSLPEYDVDKMSDAEILPLTVGMTKTPSLRNLGHSAPYFHDGHAKNLETVLAMYIAFSQGSRHGTVTVIDPKIKNIHMHSPHTDALIAFLKSLNEDYE